MVDGNIMNLDAVSDCLKRSWKRMGTNIKNLALALPSAAVITKKIIVPSGQREEELELAVEAEANQYIPFALDEVNLDFQVLGPAPNNAEEVEILIAASRKEKVEDRVAIAEAAGLKPPLKPTSEREFRTEARRARYSALSARTAPGSRR